MCCYLLTEARFRELQPRVGELLPWRDLQNAFTLAHDQDLVSLIGQSCVDGLCQRMADETLTDADQSLLTEAEPFLAWTILSRFLENQPSLRLDAQGVLQRADSSYTQADALQLALFGLRAGGYAVFYRERLRLWLHNHSADYPCLPETFACDPFPRFLDVPTGSAANPNC